MENLNDILPTINHILNLNHQYINMKIKEESVIDNKVIDEMISELEQSGDIFNQLSLKSIHRLELLKQLKQHSKPLSEYYENK